MDYRELRAQKKKEHEERAAKTPERLAHIEKLLRRERVDYKVHNPITGHLTAYDVDGNPQQYWAGTGKIGGLEPRGCRNFISLLKGASLEN